jgi:hypothetical protein
MGRSGCRLVRTRTPSVGVSFCCYLRQRLDIEPSSRDAPSACPTPTAATFHSSLSMHVQKENESETQTQGKQRTGLENSTHPQRRDNTTS